MAARPTLSGTGFGQETLLDMMKPKGKFYGVRGSFVIGDTKIGGHTTCHTLQFGRKLIVFDFGSGMIDIGNELTKRYLMPGKTIKDIDFFMSQFLGAGNDPKNLGLALLESGYINQEEELDLTFMSSHVHGDHLFGAQAFKPIFSPKTNIHMIGGLHCGMNIHEVMEQFNFRPPVFPVPWKFLGSKRSLQIISPDEHFEIDNDLQPIKVWVLPMNHPNGSYGYRFEWCGHIVAVTLDHEHGHEEYDLNIVRLWEGADVVVTEVQYTSGMYDTRKGFGHITAEAAAKHAIDAKPKRIITTHHDPDADYDTVQEIARTIERKSRVQTTFAVQGMVF